MPIHSIEPRRLYRQIADQIRGLIKSGYKADLVLFDPRQIIDRATFKDPQLLAEGVKRVFVNGKEVWIDGAVTGSRPGQALRLRKSLLDQKSGD